ncbi:MAG TPA: glycosyltransferase [Chthoniobacterales bacterium]|nr:glycosyltransferase [Chthoniobacterales bacterium]
MTADAVGGVWNYALELIRALPDHDFALAVMGPRMSDDQRAEVAALPNVKLFACTYALEWMDGPWEQVDRSGDWLLGIAAEFRPDLVHLNGYSHAVLPFGAPVIVVAHSCVLSWWQAVKKTTAPPQYSEYRRRVTAGVHAAALVLAPSEAMLNSLRINYDFRGAGRVIPNARDAALFTAQEKMANILAAGRVWDEAKNIAVLDTIAARVRWPVEVAGDALHPNGSSVALRNVRALGVLSSEELREHLASSAIFVLPARYEPFGLSALEAGLSGCALVLGDIPTLREIWGDAALFVRPDDRAGLERELNRLIRDEFLRSELAQKARARAEEYSPQRMIDGYLQAYADCSEPKASQAAA